MYRSAFLRRSAAVASSLPLALAGRAGAQSAAKLIMAAPPSDDVTPALYALQSGLFRKYGLDVDVQQMNSGAAIMSAAVGGSIQIGLTSSIPLVAAHAKGIPVAVVASAGVYDPATPYGLLVVKADGPIHSARDLAGAVIGSTSLRDLNSTATLAWIDQNGGPAATVKTIELTTNALLPALMDGTIAAATLVPPRLTEALESGHFRVLGKSYDAIGHRFSIATWIATTGFIAQNLDAIAKFSRAMSEATAYTDAHHAETVTMIANFTKIDPALVARGRRSVDAAFAEAADLQPVIAVAVRYGIIDRAFDARELISPAVAKPTAR
jgi:NitT/TauT family transport system substrate-binding protein